jgi:hypothetical protein
MTLTIVGFLVSHYVASCTTLIETPEWDTALPSGDEPGTRAPVEARSASTLSSRPPYRGRGADNMLAFSGQSRESLGSSFLEDTASEPGSMIVSRHSTQTNSHPRPKRPILEADEVGIVDLIDNPPESPVQYATQISPRPQKRTCTRPESPPRENGYLSFLPKSIYGTKQPHPTDPDEAKTQKIGVFETTSPLTFDRVNDPPLLEITSSLLLTKFLLDSICIGNPWRHPLRKQFKIL